MSGVGIFVLRLSEVEKEKNENNNSAAAYYSWTIQQSELASFDLKSPQSYADDCVLVWTLTVLKTKTEKRKTEESERSKQVRNKLELNFERTKKKSKKSALMNAIASESAGGGSPGNDTDDFFKIECRRGGSFFPEPPLLDATEVEASNLDPKASTLCGSSSAAVDGK